MTPCILKMPMVVTYTFIQNYNGNLFEYLKLILNYWLSSSLMDFFWVSYITGVAINTEE